MGAVKAGFVLLSHGQQDDIADCMRIATQNGAKIVYNVEIEDWLNKQGVTNNHSVSAVGKWNFGVFTVKCTAAVGGMAVMAETLWALSL